MKSGWTFSYTNRIYPLMSVNLTENAQIGKVKLKANKMSATIVLLTAILCIN